MTRRLALVLSSTLLAGSAVAGLAGTASAVATRESAVLASGTAGIALGADGNYWVAQRFATSVVRVSASGQVVGSPIEVGGAPLDVIAGPNGTIWVSVPEADKVVKITTTSPTPAAVGITVTGNALDCGPTALVDGGNGTIYFSVPGTGACEKGDGIGTINAATNAVTAATLARGQVSDMVVAGGRLWAPDQSSDKVRGLSLAPGLAVQSTVTVQAGGTPSGITLVGTQLWVTLNGIEALATFPATQINGTAPTVTPSVALSDAFHLAPSQHGTVYVASKDNGKVVDVAPNGSATAVTLSPGAEPFSMAVVPGKGVLVTDLARTRLTEVADAAPTTGAPVVKATSAGSVSVSVPVDSRGNATTVQVEYATAGAYRQAARAGRKVPSAATTVTVGTTPASASGPVTVKGMVGGLEPGSSYRFRVKVSNLRGGATSTDTVVRTPKAPKTTFTAKVGRDTTTLTKLGLKGLFGGESVKVTCKTPAKGCPFASRTVSELEKGTVSLAKLVKGAALEPGAKVTIQVRFGTTKLTTLTLTIRDGQQPKVKRR